MRGVFLQATYNGRPKYLSILQGEADMKKIMFSERYGLEQAVIAKIKTQTRRIIKIPKKFKGEEDIILNFHKKPNQNFYYDCVVCDYDEHELGQLPLPYEVGEELAVAQSYEKIYLSFNDCYRHEFSLRVSFVHHNNDLTNIPGWNNKMFVKANLMPHRIRITDIKMERLQDISEEDCKKEGIMEGEFMNTWDRYYYDSWGDVPNHITFSTARQAFASLINHINGSGTWESNPWVVAYSFRLQRAHGFSDPEERQSETTKIV